MRKILCMLCFLVFALAGPLGATTIDPTQGWTGYFAWTGGLGQIDSIDQDSSQDEWSITVAEDSSMAVATAWDAFAPGDEFAFYVDGAEVAWDETYVDGSGYFHGLYNDLFLTAGTHTLTFFVTAMADGFDYGGAYAEFSAVEPVSGAPVPEPATFFLLAIGLLGVMGLRKKSMMK
ncbi:PEP-CTERM sorting domain-containing protein [Desulfoluna spongiiphila]|uniref:PEP-CTERM protein-sorting domain-containing protein n=1 Tax=Desulfoluna spongiiphila TaxID=419481 RepID=A0A1G5C7M8_9BACT|nr:PEP-CTERM sorting domain-containing protein [Desulfoluna spongiiphila]SCX98328.1 PEP-CTERM protein-sorting domain-containing protein [Desulfoluna spongiiphila]